MPRRSGAAKASAQNIHAHFANQKSVQRNQNDVEGESIQCHEKKHLMVATAAKTVPSTDIADLDPEITDFCSRHNITPAIREFHDEDEHGPDLYVSDQSSNIEEESELKRFTQALQMAQTDALKKENKKKKVYSKNSKKTIKCRMQFRNILASKGFLPVDQYIQLKRKTEESNDADLPELDNIIAAAREESEEDSDEANVLVQDTCAYHSVNSTSEVESEEDLPGHNVQLRRRHLIRMESEESTGDDDNSGVGDYARQRMSKDKIDDKETLTVHEYLEVLRHDIPVHQEISTKIPGSVSHILSDHSKLQEARTQLTKEMKKGDLDVIVRARITAMIGLLNIYTDDNLGYSWKKASEVMATTHGCGTNRARRIREWVLEFLRWRDLPLHQLDRKRGIIVDDEDIAQEIKTRMVEKAKGSFLKAQDLVEIVTSPDMQAIFAQKGITKLAISPKMALRWLEKLGWSYGKLKNSMYLDGHKRSDVVEYQKAFVERWMGHERRFHRWDHNGNELPRPDGFPVPGAIGRFRLILVTHDESTFFQNDECATGWNHADSKSKPKAKGNGQTLMVSDFLTPDWGHLRDGDE